MRLGGPERLTIPRAFDMDHAALVVHIAYLQAEGFTGSQARLGEEFKEEWVG
jgi:hypothetical protein